MSAQRLVAVALATMLSGCVGESQFNYSTELEQRDWIGTELLEEMVRDRWPRTAAIARLGEPDAVNDATRNVGYLRCITNRHVRFLVLVVPTPIPTSATATSLCQLFWLRFDDQDAAAEWDYCGPLAFSDPIDDEGRRSLENRLNEWMTGAACEGPRDGIP
jgi:hypothetical protein